MKEILLLVLLCGVSDSLWSQTRNSRSKNAREANASNVEQGVTKQVDLGKSVALEVVYVPAGKFMMGSTPEEKAWATSRVGGDSRDGFRICLGAVK